MKKIINLLITALVAITACGVLRAADFEDNIRNIEKLLADAKSEPQAALPVPAAQADIEAVVPVTRWWSALGSAHEAISDASLKAMDAAQFPDIVSAGSTLIAGANCEAGHVNSKANGGKVKDYWFGIEPRTGGGVLRNYEQFSFTDAYFKLGMVIHLTQDQAVPTHAANILHSFNDSFEGYFSSQNNVRITEVADGAMEPYVYYQALQDDTRGRLAGWVSPKTGNPYWVPAADAPRMGVDATEGSWGRYGPDGDVYTVRKKGPAATDTDQIVTLNPEIRLQRLAAAGVATVNVYKSASKRLPPLVANLSVSTLTFNSLDGLRIGYAIHFNVYENRSPRVTYKVSVYKDGELLGIAARGKAALGKANQNDIMYSAQILSGWAGTADSLRLPTGNYVLDVRVTDEDGNTTPDEVNTDDIPANDTRVPVTII